MTDVTSYYYEDHYDTHRKTCLNMAYFQCQDCDYYADNARVSFKGNKNSEPSLKGDKRAF